jgi:hypothetical protein
VVRPRVAALRGGAPSGHRCASSPLTATQAKLRRAPHRRSQDELEIKINRTKKSPYPNPLGAAAFKAGDERHPNYRLALLSRAYGEKGWLADYLCHTRTRGIAANSRG